MRALWAIIKSTWGRDCRTKPFWAFVFISMGSIILFSMLMGLMEELIIKNQGKTPENYPEAILALTTWFSNLLSLAFVLFLGVSTILTDQKSLILPSILSGPLSRGTYLWGRFLGTWSLGLGFFLITAMGIIAVASSQLGPHFFPNFASSTVLTLLLATSLLILSIEASLIFSSRILSFFILGCLFILIVMAHQLAHFPLAGDFGPLHIVKGVGLAVYWIFPRFWAIKGPFEATLLGQALPPEFDLGPQLAHFLGTTVAHGGILFLLFQRRTI